MTTTANYDPFAEREVKHPTTDFDTFIHLVKGALGAGILAMPYAFKHIGLWTGVPCLILVTFICGYCIHMLVKVSQTLCYRCRVPRLTYAETAMQAFQSDPKEFKKFGTAMGIIVNVFITLGLLSAICLYLLITGGNLQQIINLHAPGNGITLRVWIIILTLPLIFLCLIRELKFLVPFSLAANFLMFIALIITYCFIFSGLNFQAEKHHIKDIKLWPVFFCTSIAALECIGVVLPCENKMKNPQHFTGCPSVLLFAMFVLGLFYALTGFFGYFKYGEGVESNITLNLPIKNPWSEIVKIAVGIAVYFTILLQFYVPINIILNGISGKFPENRKNLCENSVRIAAMILCCFVAVAFPDLGPFVSFIGATFWNCLGIIFPAILDIIVFRNDPGYGWCKIHLIKDILLIMVGLFLLIFGTFESIKEFDVKFKLNLNLGH